MLTSYTLQNPSPIQHRNKIRIPQNVDLAGFYNTFFSLSVRVTIEKKSENFRSRSHSYSFLCGATGPLKFDRNKFSYGLVHMQLAQNQLAAYFN